MLDKSGYVYFMSPEKCSGAIKVGRAKDPYSRAKSLRRQYDMEFNIIRTFETEDCYQMERYILREIKNRGYTAMLGSETFEIPLEELEEVVVQGMNDGEIPAHKTQYPLAGYEETAIEIGTYMHGPDISCEGFNKYGSLIDRLSMCDAMALLSTSTGEKAEAFFGDCSTAYGRGRRKFESDFVIDYPEHRAVIRHKSAKRKLGSMPHDDVRNALNDMWRWLPARIILDYPPRPKRPCHFTAPKADHKRYERNYDFWFRLVTGKPQTEVHSLAKHSLPRDPRIDNSG